MISSHAKIINLVHSEVCYNGQDFVWIECSEVGVSYVHLCWFVSEDVVSEQHTVHLEVCQDFSSKTILLLKEVHSWNKRSSKFLVLF